MSLYEASMLKNETRKYKGLKDKDRDDPEQKQNGITYQSPEDWYGGLRFRGMIRVVIMDFVLMKISWSLCARIFSENRTRIIIFQE